MVNESVNEKSTYSNGIRLIRVDILITKNV